MFLRRLLYFLLSALPALLAQSALPALLAQSALLALLAQSATAQDSRDSTVVLGAVVVVDERYEAHSRSGIRFSGLESRRLRLRGNESVADLLTEESFLFIQRSGPSGLATASLRGAGSVHTQVLLDGLRLADPQTGQVDLTTLPASFIESIAIGHGGGNAATAKSALGGTVFLSPLRPAARASVSLSATAGAYGRRQAGVSISQPIGKVRTVIAIERSRYDGAFPFSTTGGSTGTTMREGADRASSNIYTRMEGNSGVGAWHVSAWLSTVERGIPGPSNASPIWARQDDRALRVWAGQQVSIPGGRLESAISYSRSKLDYALPTPLTPTRSASQAVQLRSNMTHVLSGTWWTDVSLFVSYEEARLHGGVHQLAGGLRGSGSKTMGPVSIHPMLGMELYEDREQTRAGLLPGMSLEVQPLSTADISIHASTSRILRAPTFNDRYWLPGGNPDLAPERGWSADAGIAGRYVADRFSVDADVTVFASRLNDKITWRPTLSGSSIQTWSPYNIGEAVGNGVESSLVLRTEFLKTVNLTIRGMYSRTSVQDRSDRTTRSFGRQLRYVPEQVFKARSSVQYGRYGLDLILNATGKRFITSDESQALQANAAVSVRFRLEQPVLGGRLHVQVTVENATDAMLESMRFYPMPPRHARLSIRFERGLTREIHEE